ncbi:MAG: hypothetical protein DDT26_01077 [Dehalococcoidia bacterium]|nr:hypothetical protein [Chloroflexota bacterium]
MSSMIPPTYLSVLRKTYTRLDDGGVSWVVTGRLGFALQGVPWDDAVETISRMQSACGYALLLYG